MNKEEQKQELINLLKDAYAMEEMLVTGLEGFAEEFENYPKVRQGIEEHREVTKRHSQDVASCLEGLDEKTPGMKATWPRITSSVGGVGAKPLGAQPIQNITTLIATEELENATYLAIAEAARMCGENSIAQMAKKIAEEERATAGELYIEMPKVVKQFLGQRQAAKA